MIYHAMVHVKPGKADSITILIVNYGIERINKSGREQYMTTVIRHCTALVT